MAELAGAGLARRRLRREPRRLLDELDIIDATTGATTKIALPSQADRGSWTSTWIPGDDAAIAVQ